MSISQGSRKWASYEDGDFSILQKGYSHEHPFRFNLQYQTAKGKVQLEEKIRNTQHRASTLGEVRFWIPLPGTDRLLSSRWNSSGKAGFNYDNGQLELKNGFKLNFSGGFQTSRNCHADVWKIGAACIGENFKYSVRFRYASLENEVLVHAKGSHRGKWEEDNWRAEFYSLVDPRISKCIKNGILLGLATQSQHQLFLRLESGKRKKTGLHWCEFAKQLKLTWVRALNENCKLALEAKVIASKENDCCEDLAVGGQWKFPESKVTLRAKISLNLLSALSISHSLGSYGNYGFGAQWNGVTKPVTFGTYLSINA